MFFAGIGHRLGTIAFGQHHHRSAVRLEEIDIAVHASGGGGAEGA